MNIKEIPKNWQLTAIEEICTQVKVQLDPLKIADTIYIGLEHIHSGGTLTGYGSSKNTKSLKSKFEKGDILYGKLRPYLNKHLITKVSGICSTDIVVFRTTYTETASFLNYFMGTEKFISNANEAAKGINLPRVSSKEILEFKLQIPPLPEQQRIVAKLDTLFGHLDALKNRLDRIPQLLKDFRQKVLTQAVNGKLTEEWRDGRELESVEALFDKIIEKRKKRYLSECKLAKQQGERKPTKVYLDELPEIEEIDVDLPQQWMQTNIHFLSFVTKLAGFEYTDHFKISENGEIPVVRAQNVQMGRFEDKNRLYIEKKTSDFLVRSQLHGREILMVFIGAGTGNVCIAPQNERWHLAPNVAKIDIDGVDTKYIYFYLQSNLGISNVLSRIKATAQPSLSMETIREIVALVPPLEEQQEIVRRVESLFAKADQIEASYQKLKTKIEQLPQALLAKAFRGELVEQLPTDGDARDLLEQIKRAKEGLEKSGKGRKLKVVDEVRMVAEPEVKYKKKI